MSKEKIILDKPIGVEKVQVMIEGDIIVPDIKPDIAKVLQIDGKVYIENTEAISERVSCDGKVDIVILYLSEGANRRIHSMKHEFPINDFIHVDHAEKGMNVYTEAEIQYIDHMVLNGRKMNIKAVVELRSKVTETIENEVVTHVDGVQDVQVLKDGLTLSRTLQEVKEKRIIKDQINVPMGKPNMRETLKMDIKVLNKEIKIMEDKVIVKGELNVCCLYAGDSDQQPVDFIERDISFAESIEIAGTREGMYGDVDVSILETYGEINEDDDGEERIYNIEVVLGINSKIQHTEKIDLLKDCYAPMENLQLKKQEIPYKQIVCKNRTQTVIKEAIEIEKGEPNILQIYNVLGKVNVDEMRVIDDKVIVEGSIDCNLLYLASDDHSPLYAHQATVPFRQVIETKGSAIDMKVDLKAYIENVSFNMLSPTEVEIRFVISFDTKVTRDMTLSMIVDVVEEEFDMRIVDEMPSIIIYVVQTGDTLWKIAKKYNTTVETLKEVNDLDTDLIYPGQKLLILKNVMIEEAI